MDENRFARIAYNAIPGLLLGAVVGGIASSTCLTIQDAQGASKKLVFRPEAFDMDPVVAQHFLELQTYRPLSPDDFDEAGSEVDSVFCLEKQLVLRELQWEQLHMRQAIRCKKRLSDRLDSLFELAKNNLVLRRNGDGQQPPAGVSDPKLEKSKEDVRKIYVLIEDIKKCVDLHVRKIAGGFRSSPFVPFRSATSVFPARPPPVQHQTPHYAQHQAPPHVQAQQQQAYSPPPQESAGVAPPPQQFFPPPTATSDGYSQPSAAPTQ